jgi:general secretion pathway protein G
MLTRAACTCRGDAVRPARGGGRIFPSQFANERAKRVAARRRRLGFTLVELLLALTLASLLASIATPRLRAALDAARTARAISEVRLLQQEITERAMSSSLPATLADIGRAGMLDPWGRPYVYYRFPPCAGGGSGCSPPGARKDHFLVPLNSDYDLYSVGPDGKSVAPLTANASKDDIVRANDGAFIGVAATY